MIQIIMICRDKIEEIVAASKEGSIIGFPIKFKHMLSLINKVQTLLSIQP